MEIMVMAKATIKNMHKAERMAKSTTARAKRKATKTTVRERTLNLFAKLRRLRKNK